MPTAPVLRIVVGFLATIGIFASAFLVWLLFSVYQSSRQETRRDLTTNRDVAYVLNAAGLDSSQKFQVSHSFQSEVPLISDDHFEAFCISLEKSEFNSSWKRFNQLPVPFQDAIAFGADNAKSELSCFPSSSQLTTGNFLVQATAFRFILNGQIDGAEVAILEPGSNSLFYFSFQM